MRVFDLAKGKSNTVYSTEGNSSRLALSFRRLQLVTRDREKGKRCVIQHLKEKCSTEDKDSGKNTGLKEEA